MMMHVMGMYVVESLYATVGNMFRGKGQKPHQYPDKPYELFGEEPHELTEEEIRKGNEDLFMRLALMQINFENHKALQEENKDES